MLEVDMREIEKRRRVVDAFLKGVSGMSLREALEIIGDIARELGAEDGVILHPLSVGDPVIQVHPTYQRDAQGRFVKKVG